MPNNIVLSGKTLTLEQVVSVARHYARVEISAKAKSRVLVSRAAVDRIANSSKKYYGVNTGFGRLADAEIDQKDIEQLQLNLIRSHSVGTGEALSEEETRALMVVRLNSLLAGYSGVSFEVVHQLVIFLNRRIYPMIPRYGSLGASGDLAPSAHLASCLIGEGFIFEKSKLVNAERALSNHAIRPIKLRAKDGLAIINGTQAMTGIGCLLVHDAELALKSMDFISAMSLEALGGSVSPFDRRVQRLRPHKGQIEVAERIGRALKDSTLVGIVDRVQDPYSLRCIPQVHGAFHDCVQFARSTIETELNSVTDNPIVFPESNTLVNAGNFHGQPVSMALDLLCIAIAEASIISERRIDKMLSGSYSQLPLFLTSNPGLNSGLMVTQYSAAALVARNKTLAMPASLESVSVSAGQEDHASMGMNAALKAREVLQNTFQVLAIEALCAAQAIDFVLSKKHKQGIGTSLLHDQVRKLSSRVQNDRSLFEDVQHVTKSLESNIAQLVEDKVIGFGGSKHS